jgi:toxin FitB
MSGFLLDTNCISELVLPRPEPRVVEWMEAVDESSLHLSALTLGEIRKGIAQLSQERRRARLEGWLDADLRARFAGRILPIDASVADRWGLLAAEAKRAGLALAIVDGLLAATALHYNLTIVSRNVNDFRAAQVQVFDPWNA